MDSPSKTSRKVRFTLPENQNNFVSLITSRNSPAVQVKKQPPRSTVSVDTKVHGTCRYINGTLNFVQEDFKPVPEENNPKVGQKVEPNKIVDPKHLRPCIKPPRKSREVKRTTVETDTNSTTKSLPLPSSLSKKFHYFIRSRSESRGRKKELSDRNRKSSTGAYSYVTFYFPDTMKTNSTMPLKPPRQNLILQKTPDILTVPALSTTISLNDSMSIPPNNQCIDVLPNVHHMNLNDYSIDCESIPQISTNIQQLPHMNQMVNNDENLQNFTQFFDRWRQLENPSDRKLLVIQTSELKMNCESFSQDVSTNRKLLTHNKMPDGKSPEKRRMDSGKIVTDALQSMEPQTTPPRHLYDNSNKMESRFMRLYKSPLPKQSVSGLLSRYKTTPFKRRLTGDNVSSARVATINKRLRDEEEEENERARTAYRQPKNSPKRRKIEFALTPEGAGTHHSQSCSSRGSSPEIPTLKIIPLTFDDDDSDDKR